MSTQRRLTPVDVATTPGIDIATRLEVNWRVLRWGSDPTGIVLNHEPGPTLTMQDDVSLAVQGSESSHRLNVHLWQRAVGRLLRPTWQVSYAVYTQITDPREDRSCSTLLQQCTCWSYSPGLSAVTR